MIDFHTHPVLIREFVEKHSGYERMARRVFNIGNNFQPLETFFLQMDAAGIERAVLLPIDCRRARKDPVSSNEQVAELCALSKRFIGFASVDPMKKNAVRDLENAVRKLGLCGLKLDPALQDFRPHDRKAIDVYSAAADLKIPLLIHTGMSWAPETPLALGNPLLLEEPIRKVPTLNFVLGALGMALGVGGDRAGAEVSERLSRHLVPLLRQPEGILSVRLQQADSHDRHRAQPAQ